MYVKRSFSAFQLACKKLETTKCFGGCYLVSLMDTKVFGEFCLYFFFYIYILF